MASGNYFPDLSPVEIAKVLEDEGIAAVTPADLARPTPELLTTIFSNLFVYLDPLRSDSDAQIGFGALQLLENPENHSDAIRVLNLFNKIKDFFASIKYTVFNLRDLLRPDHKRTIQHLSCLVNFLYYRNEKLTMLKPVLDEFPNYEERKAQLTQKIAELKAEISSREMEARMEEPVVKQLESEVKGLEISIQNYNKQQVSLKTEAKDLKEKIDSINDKISKADFELMKQAQENCKLSSKIVQSPEKLQKALEEKKSARAEAKNGEKLITQQVQKKTSQLETCTKAHGKISKHVTKIQALQEQGNKNKALEKEVKALKLKLSDETVSLMTLEAKIVEKQGEVKQAEETLKVAERERDVEMANETQKLNALKSEIEWKLNCLEPRERNAESMVSKGNVLLEEAEAITADGIAKQEQILSKIEEIAKAFDYYMVNNTERFGGRAEELEGSSVITPQN